MMSRHLAIVPPRPDFLLRRHGLAYLLEPLSAAAQEFVDLNSTYGLPDDAPIEARWVEEVLNVLADNGFTVVGRPS